MQLGNRANLMSFATTPTTSHQRSQFDRSFTVKDTMQFDYCNPVFVDEVLPGDTMNLRVNAFARLSTQIRPLMDNAYIDWHFFFVPMRLVWSNTEKFFGAQDNPGDSISYTIPTVPIALADGAVGSIYDKFGIPTDVATTFSVNVLPFRCYNLIWNTWYRAEDLQNSITVNTGNGPDTAGTYALKKRGKRHNYFTAALPWPQKGSAVSLPLGTSAPVAINASTEAAGTSLLGILYKGNSTQAAMYAASTNVTTGNAASSGSNYNLFADLSAATAATINQLRESFMIQALLERDARSGTRYVEWVKSAYGVIVPDFRVQRPEFLGGGTCRINSHPVAQTTATSGSNAQAQLAAFGTSSTLGEDIGFSKSFVEHGYVIGIANARADITYQQGLHKMWTRSTRYDIYDPMFANLGEQAVLQGEIYKLGTSADNTVFGYQERHAEYRYKQSEIRGKFRSTASGTLDVYHLAEKFLSAPTLNDTFIQSTTPIDRIQAVNTEPHLLMDIWFQLKHARAMPVRAIPANLARL